MKEKLPFKMNAARLYPRLLSILLAALLLSFVCGCGSTEKEADAGETALVNAEISAADEGLGEAAEEIEEALKESEAALEESEEALETLEADEAETALVEADEAEAVQAEAAQSAAADCGTQSAVTQSVDVEESAATTTTAATTVLATESTLASATSFDVSTVAAYSGTAYAIVNNNVPYFTTAELTTVSFESYSNLDSLGRCGVAMACIGTDIMPTESRGAIGSVKPTGWHTVKYDCISDLYLYNRCHLIAFELAGENANEKNLITGTRYMNVTGMLPFENEVTAFVKSTEYHVMYRVTPIFEGNNLVASGVLMEAYSVEDAGAGIQFCVYCYNVQPGIVIDYATGDSYEDGSASSASSTTTGSTSSTSSTSSTTTGSASTSDSTSSTTTGNASTSSTDSSDSTTSGSSDSTTSDSTTSTSTTASTTYILNTNTKKFHYPACSSVNKMKESNKQEYYGTRDEVISQGYSPCGNCNP